jgi:hypothetical protein
VPYPRPASTAPSRWREFYALGTPDHAAHRVTATRAPTATLGTDSCIASGVIDPQYLIHADHLQHAPHRPGHIRQHHDSPARIRLPPCLKHGPG